MYYLGIDVHKDELHVAVLDKDGEIDRAPELDRVDRDTSGIAVKRESEALLAVA